MSGGARGSWSSVTSRFQSDSPLSLRAELLERTSKIHSSGARERENYPLLLRRVVGRVGKYFKFLRLPPPPLAIMMPSRSKFRSRASWRFQGGAAREGGAVFPGSDSSEAQRPPKLVSDRVLVSTEEEKRMEDHRGSK